MKLQAFYEQSDPAEVQALIRRCRMGFLAAQGNDGAPLLGWVNATPVEGAFVLHLAAEDVQARALALKPDCVLSYGEVLSSIPSHWVDARDGGRATHYYLHAEFHCRAQVLEGAAAVEALQAMLRDYQPEGGYADMQAQSQVYEHYYPRLLVAHLAIQAQKTKWKLGQNLSLDLRKALVAKLKERNRPEDESTAQAMEAWMQRVG